MSAKHDGPIPEEWKQRFEAWANEVKERGRAPGELLSYVESTNPKKVSRQGNGEVLMCSPLRSERTPSFRVYPDGHWRDFGLDGGKSGDMLTFVRLFGNLSYRDGLEHMAQLFGIQGWEDRKKTLLGTTSTPLPENLERDMIERWTGDYIEEDTVFAAMTWLAQAAARCLPDQARAHLEAHYHLLPKTLEAFAVGYCPAGFWELVTSPEWECPYSRRTLLSTGWFRQGGLREREMLAEWDLAWDDDTDPTGVITPVFLDRLVFPYWKNGAVRYAIGRQWFGKATKQDLAAYLETHAWDAAKYRKVPKKSDTRPYVSNHVQNIVWNEDCLRRARGGIVYITEGITDALLLAQLGLFVISPSHGCVFSGRYCNGARALEAGRGQGREDLQRQRRDGGQEDGQGAAAGVRGGDEDGDGALERRDRRRDRDPSKGGRDGEGGCQRVVRSSVRRSPCRRACVDDQSSM